MDSAEEDGDWTSSSQVPDECAAAAEEVWDGATGPNPPTLRRKAESSPQGQCRNRKEFPEICI